MEQEKKSGFSRWDWFAVIEKLAGGDITKFEAVENQYFILALNLLSYQKERDEQQKKMNKK